MDEQERKELELDTRKEYHSQHSNYVFDDVIFNRFYQMASKPEYYHLAKSHFKGAHILDSGCGNSAYFQCVMLDLDVEKITCLELGEDWIPALKEGLIHRGYEKQLHKIEFVPGSTAALPFEDNTFDMVFSNGVLMHLPDWEMINKAQKELCRVTRRGGYLYEILGIQGGLMDELTETARKYIRENADPKNGKLWTDYIKGLSLNDVHEVLEAMNKTRKEHGDSEMPLELFLNLFDTDYTTFLQNVLRAPTQHQKKLTLQWATQTLLENGFEEPKRCKRYVHRENVRNFWAPLHYNSDIWLSRLLFGEASNMEIISRKK